jgi:hypothetical protein
LQNTRDDRTRWEEVVLQQGLVLISSDEEGEDADDDVIIVEEETTTESKRQLVTGEYKQCRKSRNIYYKCCTVVFKIESIETCLCIVTE